MGVGGYIYDWFLGFSHVYRDRVGYLCFFYAEGTLIWGCGYMRYYCQKTKLEYSGYPCGDCEKVCVATSIIDIPFPETVSQWEKRKGYKYPATAPVYWWYDKSSIWILGQYSEHIGYPNTDLVVATEAGAPPPIGGFNDN